ncbi:general odorant-binding protein 45-like [Anopheles stephensi]|uniref:general odorant-binding protein 45-like n=1 Tax=Anopheles stephensi TaxID=30069 RepID=UPI0016589633|nr:general odorant-binding protein 45-like [Anopheles stephensi]
MASFRVRYVGLVWMLTTTVITASQRYHDCVQKKNVAQAQEECVRYLSIPCARLAVYNDYIYPNDTATQCMVRCMGINLGWWDDTDGVQEPAIRHYFHPDPDDEQYDRRTYHCLKSQRLDYPTPHGDACERAYESFRCYYEQYGNIVVTPQFVPLSPLQLSDVMGQCAKILQTPGTGLGACGKAGKPSERDIGCLARCFLMRSGLYTDQHGPNLDRLYVQCNNYANETKFRETTGACYRQLKLECKDNCVLVGRFLRECFYEGGVNINITLDQLAAILSVGVTVLGTLIPALSGIAGSVASGVIPVVPDAGSVVSEVVSLT